MKNQLMVYRPRQLRLRAAHNAAPFRAGRWGADEDEGRLTASFWQTIAEVTAEAEAKGRNTSQIEQLVTEIDVSKITEAIAEAIFPTLRENLPALTHQLRDGEGRIRSFLDRLWGPADRLYQASAYTAYEIGDRVSRSVSRDTTLEALLGIHARACRVAAEVRFLAMNGFAAGAAARWRSLHELTVVALLIGNAGDELAQRYLSFAIVERYKDAVEYQQHARRLGADPFSDSEIQHKRAEYDAVIAKHGLSMAKENGWAAPLVLQSGPTVRSRPRPIQFRELEALAQLDHLRPFYRLGSHHVHAGARAADLNTIQHLPDGPVVTTGSTVFADIAETCHGAMSSLRQVTAALVEHEARLDSAWSIEHLVGLRVLERLFADAYERYTAAVQRARDLDLIPVN